MLNGRHVIPAQSVVSAALFRLEFVFNVVAPILGLCCRRPVSDNQHMVLVWAETTPIFPPLFTMFLIHFDFKHETI